MQDSSIPAPSPHHSTPDKTGAPTAYWQKTPEEWFALAFADTTSTDPHMIVKGFLENLARELRMVGAVLEGMDDDTNAISTDSFAMHVQMLVYRVDACLQLFFYVPPGAGRVFEKPAPAVTPTTPPASETKATSADNVKSGTATKAIKRSALRESMRDVMHGVADDARAMMRAANELAEHASENEDRSRAEKHYLSLLEWLDIIEDYFPSDASEQGAVQGEAAE